MVGSSTGCTDDGGCACFLSAVTVSNAVQCCAGSSALHYCIALPVEGGAKVLDALIEAMIAYMVL